MSEQEKKAPNRGKQAGSVGAALAAGLILQWVLKEAGVADMPEQVMVAVASLISWGFGFFTDR